MPICITGMHRSGTSMVTRLLNLCGLYLGSEADLLNPAPDNPEGYWENARFVRIDEALLEDLGGGWDFPPTLPAGWEQSADLALRRTQARELVQTLAGYERWGWKDPRASLTLPFWQNILPDLQVLICARNPLEVARSLRRRGYNSNQFSFNLWQIYNTRLLEASAPNRRLVTHHDAYFHDPEAELRRVVNWLGWTVPEELLTKTARTVSTALRHHHLTASDLQNAGFSGKALELYASLCDEAGPIYRASLEQPSASPGTAARTPSSRNGTAELQPLAQIGALEDLVARQEKEIEGLAAEKRQLLQAYGRLENWARELERLALEQQTRIRKYERWLRPWQGFKRVLRILYPAAAQQPKPGNATSTLDPEQPRSGT